MLSQAGTEKYSCWTGRNFRAPARLKARFSTFADGNEQSARPAGSKSRDIHGVRYCEPEWVQHCRGVKQTNFPAPESRPVNKARDCIKTGRLRRDVIRPYFWFEAVFRARQAINGLKMAGSKYLAQLLLLFPLKGASFAQRC